MTFFPWSQVWAQLDAVEADLHERYGIDLSSGILARRTARWLRVHVEQLLTVDSRLHRILVPPQPQQVSSVRYG